MITVSTVRRGCDSIHSWQEVFLRNLLPRVERLARFQFRMLRWVDREEATAEAVAIALGNFVRLLEQGKNPVAFAGRLAQVAVLRVRSGRLYSSPDNSRDILSRLARQRRGFRVESLDSEVSGTPTSWQALLVDDGKATPAELAIARIDFAAWLNQMHRRRRKIAQTLAAGYRTEEVAHRFRLSPSRISQMRREFETSWQAFQKNAS